MDDELVFERKGRPVEWQDKLKFSEQTRTRLLAVATALPEIGDWARVKWRITLSGRRGGEILWMRKKLLDRYLIPGWLASGRTSTSRTWLISFV